MKALPILLALSFLGPASAQTPTPTPQWVSVVQAPPGGTVPSDLALGGGTLTATGTSRPGPNTLYGTGASITADLVESTVFVAGLAPDGRPTWLRPGEGSTASGPLAGYVAAATERRTYTGEGPAYQTDTDFWARGASILVARDSRDGAVLWTRTFGEPDPDATPARTALVLGLAPGAGDNLFVVGMFRGRLTLGTDVLDATPGTGPGTPNGPLDLTAPYDVFVAHLDPDGAPTWAVAIGGPGGELVGLNALDPRAAFGTSGGAVLLAGTFPQGTTVRYTASEGVPVPEGAGLLALDPSGATVRWVGRDDLGVTSEAYPFLLAGTAATTSEGTASGGGPFALGWWFPSNGGASEVRVGGGTVVDPALGGRFVTLHGADGSLRWAHGVVGGGREAVTALVGRTDGGVWVGGTFEGADLQLPGAPGTTLPWGGGEDGFALGLDATGRPDAAVHAAGLRTERVTALAIADGAVYVAGESEAGSTLNGVNVSAGGTGRRAFVARFDGTGPLSAGEPVARQRGIEVRPVENPIRQTAVLAVDLPAAASVRLSVYDALGRRVAEAPEQPLGQGRTVLPLDLSSVAPGVYVVRAMVQEGGAGTRSAACVVTLAR